MNIIVWHRRDLRTDDNEALYRANVDGNAIPVFIFEDRFFTSGTYSPKRLDFLFATLADLDAQYKRLGSSLITLHGNSLDRIQALAQDLQAKVYFNEDTNGLYGIERDQEARERGFVSFKNSAVQVSGRTKDWSIQTTKFFESSIPEVVSLPTHTAASDVSIEEFRNRVLGSYTFEQPITPGSSGGFERLDWFMQHLLGYTKAISKPILSENGTSRLSSHFSFGTISVRRVYQEAQKSQFKQKRFFQTRLFWNQHFTQKLANNPTLDKETANPVFNKYWDVIVMQDDTKIQAWMDGKTGYPLVDASMRALVETGFLNFRMRAMVASFFTYILRQPWHIGADFMFSHLIDADRAINYAQWQMQSGMIGVHPNRIYNPTKQIVDHDPELQYIRKYLPEMADVHDSEIVLDPELRKESLLQTNYYEPIVAYHEAVKNIRKTLKPINKEAFVLLQNDKDLREKLALSERASSRPKKNQLPEIKEV